MSQIEALGDMSGQGPMRLALVQGEIAPVGHEPGEIEEVYTLGKPMRPEDLHGLIVDSEGLDLTISPDIAKGAASAHIIMRLIETLGDYAPEVEITVGTGKAVISPKHPSKDD